MSPLNDEGIAYGFVMALVFLIFFGFLFALLSPAVNALISHENQFISDGTVSVQTKAAFDWNVGAFIFSIVFAILGIFYWAVIRANSQKEYGSGGP